MNKRKCPVLEVKNLWKTYIQSRRSEVVAVKNVSFKVVEGEIKVIFGPSGSGKTTLIKCIAMLIPPTKGEVLLRGTNLNDTENVNMNKMRAKIGFVFQHINLFNHLKALENVTLGLRRVMNISTKKARERAREALKKVRMEKWANHYPAQLSGGQKQRVGIARALAMDPEIILFDEPCSSLDPELTGDVLDVMFELAKEGRTMLLITHELGFAKAAADEMIFLDEGEIIERGTPEHFFKAPNNERVKEFLSRLEEF